MKTSDIIKALKKNKIPLVRHGSRHDIYRNPNTGKEFPVPRHKSEIPSGTANSILKDAGLK
jgi:predicted RNA binding protein YcfA (HicA-like mRNA interferase family)